MNTKQTLSKIIEDDCINGMKKLNDNSVDIIICDPPYNIGKDFGNETFFSEKKTFFSQNT